MKILNAALLLAAGVTCQSFRSTAAVVLTINVSDPSAVTWTATLANSDTTDSIAINFNGGITIENFFPSIEDVTTPLAITGNLTPSGTSTSYDELVSFNYGSGSVVPGRDLSVYNALVGDLDRQVFSTSVPAFTGAATIDFGGYALPSIGTVGNVQVGFQPSHGGTIGSWVAVPEPGGSAAALAVACLLIAARRALRVTSPAHGE
jgi:hypothetical protein